MNARWQRSLVVPLAGLFLSACGPSQLADASCEAEAFQDVEPRDRVEITLTEAGRVDVDPDTVRVRRGGVILLNSTRPFIVFVQRDSVLGLPTDSVLAAGRPSASNASRGDSLAATTMDSAVARMDSARELRTAAADPSSARIPIRSGAACGYYEYDLGVYDERTGRIVPLDPPLMVLPGG